MSELADAIYNTMDALVQDPQKFVCKNLMMSIFAAWSKKEVNGRPSPTYLPKFGQ